MSSQNGLTLNAMPALMEISSSPLLGGTSSDVQQVPPVNPAPKPMGLSIAVRDRIRGCDTEMQSEISESYSYLGQQPSGELLPSLPADMKKCRLAVALSVHSAYRAKELEAARVARMVSYGKREIWRPDWDTFLLADLFVIGGELVPKQTVVHTAIIEMLKVNVVIKYISWMKS